MATGRLIISLHQLATVLALQTCQNYTATSRESAETIKTRVINKIPVHFLIGSLLL